MVSLKAEMAVRYRHASAFLLRCKISMEKLRTLTGRDDQLTYVTSFALFYALLQIFWEHVNFREFRDKF